jgi:biopolymer transport protein ExbD
MNFRKGIENKHIGFQMAPMVDIIFLLLIFFIAAAVYSQWESKLEIKVPTADSSLDRARYPGEAIINIDKDGKFYLNSMEYSAERLQKLLGELSKTYPDQRVVIRADKATDCRYLIQVIDICAKTDISNLSFSTIKDSGKKN